MEKFEKEFIESLFEEGKTYEEVSCFLKNTYPDQRGLSVRSLKRYCAKHNISRRIPQSHVDNIVAEAVEEVNKLIFHMKYILY